MNTTREQTERTTSLRLAVKTYQDTQKMRVVLGNRLKIKSDGEDQVIPDAQNWAMTEVEKNLLMDSYTHFAKAESLLEKFIARKVKEFPIYNEWLVSVRGVGPMMAAIIISSYDIHRADTVSKLWSFTGLNPGTTRGLKVVRTKNPNTYQPDSGEVIKRFDETGMVIVRTLDQVRGDRRTEGYMSPFNGWLRTKMCGVLGAGFIKSRSEYAVKYYYPYKTRLEQEAQWKDEKPGHRNRAAIRYMIKMFLKDLYVAWRTLEGLPVRPSYQEEYLGHKHAV